MDQSHIDQTILARLTILERQNRRMKRLGAALLLALAASVTLGLQAGSKKIVADEISAGTINAETILVRTEKGGLVRIDSKGITLTAPGLPVGNRTNLTDHEARIEIGMDFDWLQDNALKPTPRIAVGRLGHDTSSNLRTRASIVSPEGVHSGEWHTNNPKHDGRTDRDLIDDLRKTR